ncbi:MAG: cadherin-like beta sandwich domain-containing protein [Clostridia bacterium]|nr:cadherin-like beta sandwich domain-containing protein [Clostridia bacterium]
MKNITKKIALAILITVIVCLHLTPVFAVNSKTDNNQDDDEKVLLNSLEIEGFTLEPSFNADIHQYTVETNGNNKSLVINANASEEDAIIKIIGNANLIKGQNIVSILVSDEKGNKVSTYQLYVNNDIVKPETVDEHYKNANTMQEVKKWITIFLVIVIIICLLIIKKLFRIKKEIKYNEKNKKIYEETINEIIKENNKKHRNNDIEQFNNKDNDYYDNESTVKSIQQIRENYLNINKRIQEEQEKAIKRKKSHKQGKHSK